MSNTPLKTIYFVRHGQSVDNAAPVFQGLGSPLSKQGEKQAELIANRLKHVDFDALVASPIKRANQTAQAISKASGKSVDSCDLFVECIKPSSIEDGRPWTDQNAQHVWREWRKTLFPAENNTKFEDGENYAEIIQRADDALKYLLDRPEQTIVVVTHGYFLRTLIVRALFDQTVTPELMHKFQQRAGTQNTAITVMEYRDAFEEDEAWRLWTYNDHAHFADND